MEMDEKTRLDLRQKFEKIFDSSHLANAVMKAMPSIDYEELATKTDLTNLRVELRGEMGELRGEMAELRGDLCTEMAELRADLRGEISGLRGEMSEMRGDLRSEIAGNLRTMVFTQLTTTIALAGFVATVV